MQMTSEARPRRNWSMHTISLLCIDFDGTLVDSMPAFIHSFQGAAMLLGAPALSPSHIASAMGQGSLAKCVAYLYPSVAAEDVELWITTYRDVYRDEGAAMALPYPGVLETLEALRAAGKRLAVTSNKGEPLLRTGLRDQGLLEYFELVIGELPGQPKKPDPATWEQRVAPYMEGLNPKDVLVVGDGQPDMAWAQAIGARACLAMYGYGHTETLMAYNPVFTIDSFPQLLRFC